MKRLRAPWAAYLVVSLPLTFLTFVLPDGPVRSALQVLLPLSAAAAILVGAAINRPAAPRAWHAAAATQVLWVAGDVVQTWGDRLLGPGGVRLGAGVLYLLAYLMITVAATVAARSRSGENSRADLLEASIVTAPLALITLVVLVEPSFVAWQRSGATAVPVELVFPLAVVIVQGAFIRLAQAPGPGRRSALMPALLIGLLIVLDALHTTTPPLLTAYPEPLDPRWLVFYPLAGAAVLHPRVRTVTARAQRLRPPAHPSEIVWLVLAMLAGPVLLAWQVLGGRRPSVLLTALFTVGITLLAGARMVTMLRVINAQATTDDLTGLPNRRALIVTAGVHLAEQTTRHALLLLDLNRFKEVNDSLGHHAGDTLLLQVADRLREAVGPSDTLVRLGGDEFAVLLHDQDRAGAERAAHTLHGALSMPFALDGLTVHTSASIGIVLHPEHGTDITTLLRRADAAMYRAKGEGPVVVHADGDDHHAERLRLVEELRDGLNRRELVVHYQPKVDLVTGEVTGVEALVRWDHPTRGLLLPGAFLDRAEEAGLMTALTTEVLRLALDQAQAWWADDRRLQVAVNLSASSLVDVDLPSEVVGELAARGLPASALQLEITEEFLMADRVRAQAVLGELRMAGVAIAVDDFGTGYSSLAYLRDLPIDELKLDRSFVLPMTDDPRAAALVASAVSLAHSLGLRMVAEGVETGLAYRRLAALGCDQAQGFHLTRALPAAALDRWLDTWAGTGVPHQLANIDLG